jgi:GH15 family glucan-1,4-alpha-glucosidase
MMSERKSFYGVVGNGETCALISPRGSIDWLCLPKFDENILLSKALDPVHGTYIDIVFLQNNEELLIQKTSQEYVPRTNILLTKLELKNFKIEIRDFMPWIEAVHATPESEKALIRIVSIKNISRSKKDISIKIRTNLIRSPERVYSYIKDNEIIYEHQKFALGAIFFGQNLDTITIKGNETKDIKIGLVYEKNKEKLLEGMKRWSYKNIEKELLMCENFWYNWIDRGKKIEFKNKDYEEMYCRTFLIMKLLTYEKTGAVLAAPTASFPAYPGMFENWDYRFTWIRDSFFTCKAYLLTGHYEEVKDILNFFYSVQGEDGHWKSPFYTIDGNEPGGEIPIDGLKGPKGETVFVGNSAKDQLQLDSEGSIIYATYLYFLFTKDKRLLEKYWKNIEKAADWIMKNYSKEENGLWELRERRAHYVYGKVLCWVGLESAINIAKILDNELSKKWEKTRDSLKKEIAKKGWSKQRQAFVQTYDNDSPVDISVLSLEDYGLVKPTDKRMEKTVRLIEKKLNVNGGIIRFENAVFPFYLPTLWLASHYIRTGNLKRARELIDICISSTTDLYLAAEHFDPVTRTQYGNFPQTFCMSSFIEQLLMLNKPKKEILDFLNILNVPLKLLLKGVITGGKVFLSAWIFRDRKSLSRYK